MVRTLKKPHISVLLAGKRLVGISEKLYIRFGYATSCIVQHVGNPIVMIPAFALCAGLC